MIQYVIKLELSEQYKLIGSLQENSLSSLILTRLYVILKLISFHNSIQHSLQTTSYSNVFEKFQKYGCVQIAELFVRLQQASFQLLMKSNFSNLLIQTLYVELSKREHILMGLLECTLRLSNANQIIQQRFTVKLLESQKMIQVGISIFQIMNLNNNQKLLLIIELCQIIIKYSIIYGVLKELNELLFNH
ncbi:unnamed protein product [Paramecium pentaurelia]|uniref:Uncharacterized protein n=1 Tax=Paramecium pentaurelia TaxID=43138 RepID=A0A8S1VJZ3_9CILI|nr:unnamed protein product [Paramecium pentaurelia]